MRHLIRVEQGAAYVARLSDNVEDPREARLASELVAGVTRMRRWLDFVLSQLVRGDYLALDPPLRQVLRIGAYDLLERETPPHAAVSEAVATARIVSSRGGAALANGVLRTLARSMEDGTLPVPDTGKPARDIAVRYSHPTWLVRRWLARYGEAETEALLQADNARPTFALRVNALRTTTEGLGERLDALAVGWQPSAYLDDFLVVERLQPVLRAGLIEEGWCAVQDEAAGLVVRVLDPQPGETILDGAAAPGGKALYAAQRMHNTGRLVAVDLHEARTALVEQAAAARGLSIIEPVTADLRDYEAKTLFDRVLLDAPCTGLGVLAKRADLRWQRSPED
ncbi:MAG: 16S rRNA (cytosine(967)-C(5))-methyltransferase RsmB, partial [Myxococcales bacterium]|nr:16S rRNA (cytosine(967)-C(5))-methyltransferase RsmB [Myxococcales bacterium]